MGNFKYDDLPKKVYFFQKTLDSLKQLQMDLIIWLNVKNSLNIEKESNFQEISSKISVINSLTFDAEQFIYNIKIIYDFISTDQSIDIANNKVD